MSPEADSELKVEFSFLTVLIAYDVISPQGVNNVFKKMIIKHDTSARIRQLVIEC